MRKIFSSIFLLSLCILLTASGLSALQRNKTVPDVPITGGKKLDRAHTGEVTQVKKMPGLAAPKIIPWSELTAHYFDMKRAIPHPRPQELSSIHGIFSKKIITTVDLPRVMKNYTQKSFADPKYQANEEWVQSFGNIINEFKAIKGNAKKTDTLLKKLQAEYPIIYQELMPYLSQLIRDDFLYSKKWDPYKDESVKGKQNDGILFVDHWYMQADPSRHALWNQNLGEHKVYQGAAILYADVQTIKEMEKDYANYFNQVGQDYLEVYPVKGSYYRGVDSRGYDFVRMELFLRNDLPFPYDSASYVMNILEHYNQEGFLVANYYSENKDDLNWMAGRDTYLPILTTKGQLVGNMIVTTLDFDIKSVPERNIDRIVSMKAGLGNMKRISEALVEKKNLAAEK